MIIKRELWAMRAAFQAPNAFERGKCYKPLPPLVPDRESDFKKGNKTQQTIFIPSTEFLSASA